MKGQSMLYYFKKQKLQIDLIVNFIILKRIKKKRKERKNL